MKVHFRLLAIALVITTSQLLLPSISRWKYRPFRVPHTRIWIDCVNRTLFPTFSRLTLASDKPSSRLAEEVKVEDISSDKGIGHTGNVDIASASSRGRDTYHVLLRREPLPQPSGSDGESQSKGDSEDHSSDFTTGQRSRAQRPGNQRKRRKQSTKAQQKDQKNNQQQQSPQEKTPQQTQQKKAAQKTQNRGLKSGRSQAAKAKERDGDDIWTSPGRSESSRLSRSQSLLGDHASLDVPSFGDRYDYDFGEGHSQYVSLKRQENLNSRNQQQQAQRLKKTTRPSLSRTETSRRRKNQETSTLPQNTDRQSNILGRKRGRSPRRTQTQSQIGPSYMQLIGSSSKLRKAGQQRLPTPVQQSSIQLPIRTVSGDGPDFRLSQTETIENLQNVPVQGEGTLSRTRRPTTSPKKARKNSNRAMNQRKPGRPLRLREPPSQAHVGPQRALQNANTSGVINLAFETSLRKENGQQQAVQETPFLQQQRSQSQKGVSSQQKVQQVQQQQLETTGNASDRQQTSQALQQQQRQQSGTTGNVGHGPQTLPSKVQPLHENQEQLQNPPSQRSRSNQDHQPLTSQRIGDEQQTQQMAQGSSLKKLLLSNPFGPRIAFATAPQSRQGSAQTQAFNEPDYSEMDAAILESQERRPQRQRPPKPKGMFEYLPSFERRPKEDDRLRREKEGTKNKENRTKTIQGKQNKPGQPKETARKGASLGSISDTESGEIQFTESSQSSQTTSSFSSILGAGLFKTPVTRHNTPDQKKQPSTESQGTQAIPSTSNNESQVDQTIQVQQKDQEKDQEQQQKQKQKQKQKQQRWREQHQQLQKPEQPQGPELIQTQLALPPPPQSPTLRSPTPQSPPSQDQQVQQPQMQFPPPIILPKQSLQLQIPQAPMLSGKPLGVNIGPPPQKQGGIGSKRKPGPSSDPTESVAHSIVRLIPPPLQHKEQEQQQQQEPQALQVTGWSSLPLPPGFGGRVRQDQQLRQEQRSGQQLSLPQGYDGQRRQQQERQQQQQQQQGLSRIVPGLNFPIGFGAQEFPQASKSLPRRRRYERQSTSRRDQRQNQPPPPPPPPQTEQASTKGQVRLNQPPIPGPSRKSAKPNVPPLPPYMGAKIAQKQQQQQQQQQERKQPEEEQERKQQQEEGQPEERPLKRKLSMWGRGRRIRAQQEGEQGGSGSSDDNNNIGDQNKGQDQGQGANK